MTSRTGTVVAQPAWVGQEVAPRAAGREGGERRVGGAAVEAQRLALELRVRTARPGAIGLALGLGFTLLWAFLLLGVAGPASGL